MPKFKANPQNMSAEQRAALSEREFSRFAQTYAGLAEPQRRRQRHS